MLFIHVEFQHDSRHTFLLTDSAFNKVLNTFKVIILPVAVNPIFAAPSLGLVWTVWVSTGKPEKRKLVRKIEVTYQIKPYSCHDSPVFFTLIFDNYSHVR